MFEYAKWHSNTSSNLRHANAPPCRLPGHRSIVLRRLRECAAGRARPRVLSGPVFT